MPASWAAISRRSSCWPGSGTRDIRRLGAGFGLRQFTAYRYLNEGIDVLLARTPDLREALVQAVEDAYLILDGKVVVADRCLLKMTSRKGEAIDLWYSGKTHDFSANIQAIFDPRGIPPRISDVLPGNVHDLAAARELVFPVLRAFLSGLPVLADPGYDGAGQGIITPSRNRQVKEPGLANRTRNALIRSLRGLGERGFTLLT